MLSQGGRLGRRERPESNLRHQALSLQGSQERHQGMSGQQLLRTHRSDEEQACRQLKTQQVMQPLQSLVVTPLQIIEQEQQRLTVEAVASPCPQHGTCERLKKVLALPPLRHGSGTEQFWSCDQHLGHQPCDLREPGRIEG